MGNTNKINQELSFDEKVNKLLKKETITINDINDFSDSLVETAKSLGTRLVNYINSKKGKEYTKDSLDIEITTKETDYLKWIDKKINQMMKNFVNF